MPGARLTPTLFDKLTVDLDLEGLKAEGVSPDRVKDDVAVGSAHVPLARLERYSEQAIKAAVRRELNWLFNTTRLEAATDLSRFPEVRTSVLNYGVPDLAGKTGGRRAIVSRAKELRDAIIAFEPRLNPKNLSVDVVENAERDNAITFVVRGDVVGAVQSLMVQYRTDVEIDTGACTVRD